jgi:hypothetical protein
MHAQDPPAHYLRVTHRLIPKTCEPPVFCLFACLAFSLLVPTAEANGEVYWESGGRHRWRHNQGPARWGSRKRFDWVGSIVPKRSSRWHTSEGIQLRVSFLAGGTLGRKGETCPLLPQEGRTGRSSTVRVERALYDVRSSLLPPPRRWEGFQGSSQIALHCAHRASTASSCAFCEQEVQLAAPSYS